MPGNPKVPRLQKYMYSADLSSKNIFVEAKPYLYVQNMLYIQVNVFVGFLWVDILIFSDRFGS